MYTRIIRQLGQNYYIYHKLHGNYLPKAKTVIITLIEVQALVPNSSMHASDFHNRPTYQVMYV